MGDMSYMKKIKMIVDIAENRYRYGKDKTADAEVIESYLEYEFNNGPAKEEPTKSGTDYPYTREAANQPVYRLVEEYLKIVPNKELPYKAGGQAGAVDLRTQNGVYILTIVTVKGGIVELRYDRKPTKQQIKQDILLGIQNEVNRLYFTLRDVRDGRWYNK